MPLYTGNFVVKFRHDWPPNGRELRPQKSHLCPYFGKTCGLWTNLVLFGTKVALGHSNFLKISPNRPLSFGPMHFTGKIAPRVHPRVYCGETRKPIEFIFGVNLPADNSNDTPGLGPSSPEGELWTKVLCSLRTYRPTLIDRDKIWHKHLFGPYKYTGQI